MKTLPVYLIRHGRTQGNQERRYVGSTDEGLLPQEYERLGDHFRQLAEEDPTLRECRQIIASPMKRCLETAGILRDAVRFCGKPASEERQSCRCGDQPGITVVPDMRECDFGEFEYRTYEDLKDEPAYQTFLDTLGESGFPGGETKAVFCRRCSEAFEMICLQALGEQTETAQEPALEPVSETAQEPLVFAVHGGTIMAVLDAFSFPHKGYFDWQVKPGEGFRAEVSLNDEGRLQVTGINVL